MIRAFSLRQLFIIAAVLQLVWGLVPSASQLVIQEIPVELYIAIRWTISGMIFLAYLALSQRWKFPATEDVIKVLVLGVLGYGFASIGTLYGLKIGGVTNFALMGAISPMITGIVSLFILKEKPRLLFYIAMPLSMVGLLCLVMGKHSLSTSQVALTSAGLILGASALEALTFTFSKKLKSKVGIFEYLAIAQLSAAACMWTLQLTTFHQWEALGQLSLKGMMAALFVSVVACVFCYAVLYWLLKQVDGHQLALFEGLHTLSATFFGIVLFQESLNALMLVGGTLVLTALILGNLPSKQKSLPET